MKRDLEVGKRFSQLLREKGHGEGICDAIKELADAAFRMGVEVGRERQREDCARLVECHNPRCGEPACMAADIRAGRG